MPKKPSKIRRTVFTPQMGTACRAPTFAVIGHPIAHSLSPVMHNAALKKMKIAARYEAICVKRKATARRGPTLKNIFQQIRNGEISGINVTIPHKQAVIPYVDALSPTAQKTRSVNTVYWHQNQLIGDSTDGAGYIASLKYDAQFNPKNLNVVILGAGGASLAIVVALGEMGIKSLTLINRHWQKAKNQIRKYRKIFPKIDFHVLPAMTHRGSTPDTFDFSQTHLLINATSLGMKNNPWPSLDFVKKLPKGTLVSDIVYNPKWTPLLKAAKKQGLKTHFGYGMLLYQGALAFEKFTGKKAPVAVMKKALLKKL
jgi:shikimate dehydrogenase